MLGGRGQKGERRTGAAAATWGGTDQEAHKGSRAIAQCCDLVCRFSLQQPHDLARPLSLQICRAVQSLHGCQSELWCTCSGWGGLRVMKLPSDHFQPPADQQRSVRLGEKLMQQMGWQKGQGLGKDGSGRKEHIRVKKKENTEGVGAGGGWNWGVKWWEQVFDKQAQALVEKSAATRQPSEKVVQAPAPLRDLAEAGLNSSNATQTPQAADASTGPASKKRRKASTQDQPAVKRKQSKRAADGRETDAATAAQPAVSSDSPAEPMFGRQWSALEPVRAVTACSQDGAAVAAFQRTARQAWWGSSHFVSAGQLEGLQRRKAAAERQEFTENDQTSLYNQLQSAQTSGKGGLGKNSITAGELRKSKYAGTRQVFDFNSSQTAEDGTSDSQQAAQPRIKYKKLAASVLSQAPKRKMKRSKLEKLVYELIAQHHGDAIATQCRQQAHLTAQVSKSRQFAVMDNVVSLVGA